MSIPEISVIIPVKNERLKIRACLDGILNQTIPVKEIIVIDSGSDDGTIEILKSYKKVTLIEIASQEFNHGDTRNVGVCKATSEFVILTVGDATPCNEFWIEELLSGFTDDSVAGVCGQQVVPHEKDKNPVEWFRPLSEPQIMKYQFNTAKEFESLSPAQKKNACSWDNVTAMYRRSVLTQNPFQRTAYGEDAIWAKRSLLSGYSICYNYKARVYHYHLQDGDFTFKRDFTTMYFRYKEFGFLPVSPKLGMRYKLSILKSLIKGLGINCKNIMKWYNYNINNAHASIKSYQLFMKTLRSGEEALDAKHSEICGKPPIPLKTA